MTRAEFIQRRMASVGLPPFDSEADPRAIQRALATTNLLADQVHGVAPFDPHAIETTLGDTLRGIETALEDIEKTLGGM